MSPNPHPNPVPNPTLTSVLTTDLLESLLENLPPETEARALRALQIEPSELVDPERFCWEMAKMPRLRNMLQARRRGACVRARVHSDARAGVDRARRELLVRAQRQREWRCRQ